jgi:hypothetical protein
MQARLKRGRRRLNGRYRSASYLAQIATLMLSQKVERMYYYLAMDDRMHPFRRAEMGLGSAFLWMGMRCIGSSSLGSGREL